MRPSTFRSSWRRPASRRLLAVVTAVAFGASGCAVHSWRPVADPAVPLPGRTLRAVGPAGEVWLEVVRYETPILKGRLLGGNGRVRVALTTETSLRVRRCGRPGETRPVPPSTEPGSTAEIARLTGCDVQLETREGAVAVTVESVSASGEIVGRLLGVECRAGQSCPLAPVCLDLRDYARVEELRVDEGRTVANVLLGALLLPMVGLAVWVGAYVLACSGGCSD
jgi:hypothetical protein